MNQEAKTAWLNALRSGDYKQATGKLCKINPEDGSVEGWCCLGVLTDVAIKLNAVELEVNAPAKAVYRTYKSPAELDFSAAYLPKSVEVWADLENFDPRVTSQGKEQSLSYLNDARHLSFNEIADLVEEQL